MGLPGTTGCSLLLRVLVRVLMRILPRWGDGDAPTLAVSAIHEFVRPARARSVPRQRGLYARLSL